MESSKMRSCTQEPTTLRAGAASLARAGLLLAALIPLWAWLAPLSSLAVEVKGIVLNEDATPAKGALVWSIPVYPDRIETKETKASADGRFVLDLKPGDCLLHARLGLFSGGAGGGFGVATIPRDATPPPITIHLHKQGRLRGRIVAEESGKPIPGARLWFDVGRMAVADADGRYELDGLPLRNHELFLLAPGRERIRILIDTSLRPDAFLNVKAPPGGEIRGRVSDTAGNPIPGAIVRTETSGTGVSLAALVEICDARGEFTWDGASFLRANRLTASAPGFKKVQRDGIEVTPGGKPPFIEFRLMPAAHATNKTTTSTASAPLRSPNLGDIRRRTLEGSVVDPKGKPVGGATVRWGATEYEDTHRQTRTDEKGSFTLKDVPDGEGYITVLASSFAPSFPRVPNGAREITVRLSPGQTAGGVVEDVKGAPIQAIWIVPVIRSPDPRLCDLRWLESRSTHTDSKGRFHLVDLPPNAQFDFLGDRLSDLRNQTLRLGADDNVVVLKSTGAVHGHVVDPEGKPVKDFRILIRWTTGPKPPGGLQSGGWFAGYSGPGLTFSSPDGAFVVSNLVAGNYGDVIAQADGFSQAVDEGVLFHPITSLSPDDDLLLKLKPALRLRVETIATDSGTTLPVEGAKVTLIDCLPSVDAHFQWGYSDRSWTQAKRKWTGETGAALFPDVSFDGAAVLVEKVGYARRHVAWRDGRPDIRVKLVPEAVLRGVVRTPNGRPLDECCVNLSGKQTGDQFSATLHPEDAGRFEFRGLPPDVYTFWIFRDYQRSEPQTIHLKAGQHLELSPVFAIPTRFDDLKKDVRKLF